MIENINSSDDMHIKKSIVADLVKFLKIAAREDSLQKIVDGFHRAKKIVAGEEEHKPQELKSMDRSSGKLIAKSGDKKNNAGAILITMLKAEAVKIFIIALLLFLTFKLYNEHLVPVALILGLAASAILSGAAFFGLDKK